MGWSGGTEIFDCVAAELEELSYKWTRVYNHEGFMEPLHSLVDLLEGRDWDAHQESDYYDHPVIGKILGNTFEGEDND